MKRIALLPGAIALGLSVALPVPAQQPAGGQPMARDLGEISKLVKVTAVVQAVDLKNRIVTLTGPEGNTFAVHVDDAVSNLPQVKVGDRLVVEYYEAIMVNFQKGEGIRMVTEFDDSVRAKAGTRPGAAALTRVTVVSNIWALNPTRGTVLVRGPYGHFTEVKLRDPALLTGVKVGDQMKVTFTQAVAVTIRAASP